MALVNDWELCKENVQPLKQGRNMTALNSALHPQQDTLIKEQRFNIISGLASFCLVMVNFSVRSKKSCGLIKEMTRWTYGTGRFKIFNSFWSYADKSLFVSDISNGLNSIFPLVKALRSDDWQKSASKLLMMTKDTQTICDGLKCGGKWWDRRQCVYHGQLVKPLVSCRLEIALT